ncbi:MAG: CaiB/BaiF CoA transferase family protein [Solirubrobacterales bacterium]
MGVLDGLLVADFSRVLAGPLAAMTLGDLGADVVKVEPPGGDETRGWMPPVDGEGRSTYFLSVNRNKRSLALDLKDEADLALARELVSRVDVVIENFRPGTMARFGLDYDSVSEGNPGVVYCSISGFGEGEGAALPGYDPLVEAVSGLMSVTGPADGEASKVGVAVVDVIAGMNAATGILALLNRREKTGEGGRLSIDLLSSALAGLANQSSAYLATGESPGRTGNVHPSIEPFSTFAAADGPLMICAGNDTQFRTLCEVLGLDDEAADPRYATNADRVGNRAELREAIEGALAERGVAEWAEVLNEAGVPAGPVNDIGGGYRMATDLGLEPVDEFEGIRTPASPIGIVGDSPETRLPPPELDQHGDEIRAWLEGDR